MTLTELKYVLAVVREKHFGRAAEACFVSQPTLSVAIKKLEEELGVTLFERGGGGELGITPAGQRVAGQASHIFELVNERDQARLFSAWSMLKQPFLAVNSLLGNSGPVLP